MLKRRGPHHFPECRGPLHRLPRLHDTHTKYETCSEWYDMTYFLKILKD